MKFLKITITSFLLSILGLVFMSPTQAKLATISKTEIKVEMPAYRYPDPAIDKSLGEVKSTDNISSIRIPKVSEVVKNILDPASINLSTNNFDAILAETNQTRDTEKEQESKIKYLSPLVKGVAPIAANSSNAISNFITYGVDSTTNKLGENGRSLAVADYKLAFNKLPNNEKEFSDLIKIASGNAPAEKSLKAEQTAKQQFLKIYKRVPNVSKSADNTAIKIMAYSLKPVQRNVKAETAAIGTFKSIHKHNPTVSADWAEVRAIAYSGAIK